MKTTFAAAMLTALPLASATLDVSMLNGLPGFAGLPKCATSCVMKSITSSNCGVLDFKCICSSQNFLETALKCVDTSCAVGNTPVAQVNKFAEQAIDIARSFCGKIGITLPMPDLTLGVSASGSLNGNAGANGAAKSNGNGNGNGNGQGNGQGNGSGDANANANANASANAGANGQNGANGSDGSNGSNGSDNSGNSNANAEASASVATSATATSEATPAAATTDAGSAASSVSTEIKASATAVSTTCTTHGSAATGNVFAQNGTDSTDTAAATVTTTAVQTSILAFGGTASTAVPSDVSSIGLVAATGDVSYMTVVTSSCSMVPMTTLVPVSIAAVATPEPSASMSIAMVYNMTTPYANASVPAMFTGAASPNNAVSGAGFAAMALGAIVALL